MEEQFVVEIHALGVKKTKAMIDEYNKALGDLRLTLQANFGTSKIYDVISIVMASAAINVGMGIAEAILTFGASEITSEISSLPEISDIGLTGEWNLPVEELPAHLEYDLFSRGEWNEFWNITEKPLPPIESGIQVYVKEFITETEIQTGQSLYWIDQAEKMFKSANIPARPDEIFKLARELRKAKDLSGGSP